MSWAVRVDGVTAEQEAMAEMEAFIEAARDGDLEAVRAAVAAGVPIDASSGYAVCWRRLRRRAAHGGAQEDTALHRASARGHVEVARWLCGEAPALLWAKDRVRGAG